MTGDAWRPLTWKDPESLEFANRYTPDRLNDIVRHADVHPEQRDLFLTRVLTIAHATMIDAQQSRIMIPPKQRSSLKALHKELKRVVTRVETLEPATLASIAIEAKEAKLTKAKSEKAKGLRLHEPTDWIDENGSIQHRTEGRPTAQKEFQVWATSAIGQHIAKGGEKYVKRAISHIDAFRRRTEETLKNHPPRKRERPTELIVRAAVLRLLRVWCAVRPTIPATSRGPFSRFVEAALRPAVQGYWPDEREFENPIDDVLTGE